jgi:DNA polymerase-3 subunit alpha
MFFPQLQTTTAYSLLQSTIRIDTYIQQAKELGYDSIAITDKDVLHGVVEFYQKCKKEGLHPIIGINLTYKYQETEYELLLYAKSYSGYQIMMELSSKKMIEGEIALTDFPYTEELIAVLPANTPLRFETENETFSEHWALLRSRFAASQFFAGITNESMPEEDSWFDLLEKESIESCALRPIAVLRKEEQLALNVMEHLKNGTQISAEELTENQPASFYMLSQEELRQAFTGPKLERALENARAIAQAAQCELPLHQKLLPHFPLEQGEDAGGFLKKLCQTQLEKRVPGFTAKYQERLDYELNIIHEMGFDDYFLIVWDVMAFAHKKNIVTGAGRGSAAGSLVAYVLAITDVDPLVYDLLFERFLNPERYTMPDIDLDIPDNRREEVLNYVKEKYGQYHMAQIATFGTMAAKMVLRDVARVFGLSQSEANQWAKAVPNTLKITLSQAYQSSARLAELAQSSKKNQLMFQVARILEGLPRHVSTHAAGVVISDHDLLEYVPLQQGSDTIFLTQYTMNDVETVGLLKMDFLGLKNLSIIDNTLKNIKRVEGQPVALKQIPLNDPKTLLLFQKGETSGIFQFESAGIKNVLRRLEPESIEDIAAVNALYRPGPMQNIDMFIARKKGKEAIDYPDRSLEPILKNTYGVIVYQEQIIQVASKMAGFTLGQADILRRAISKKKKEVLDEERAHFVEGAQKQGYAKDKAMEVYDYIERFANYGFNRSHAFAYSVVGFQMAYLKVHHPGAFFTSLMNASRHTTEKLKEYIAEAHKNNIRLLQPSINQSRYGFELIDKQTILFGLTAVKGVRRDFTDEIINERKENGPYRSFDQFLIRIDKRWLKKEVLEPLAASGAFDELEPNRKQLIDELEGKIQNVLYSGGSQDLLGIMELKKKEKPDYTLEERLQLEEEYLGVYLSGHPTEGFEKLRIAKRITPLLEIIPNQQLHLLLYIRKVREIKTKKGELMAFVEGTDSSGEISVTVFPQLYRQARAQLQPNQVVYVEGRSEISKFNQEMQVIGDMVADPQALEASLKDITCYLRITEENDQPEVMRRLREILKKHPGHIPVILFFEATDRKVALTNDFWINDSQSVQRQLHYLLKEENVVFK